MPPLSGVPGMFYGSTFWNCARKNSVPFRGGSMGRDWGDRPLTSPDLSKGGAGGNEANSAFS